MKNTKKNRNSCFSNNQGKEAHEQDLANFEFIESQKNKKDLYNLIWTDNKSDIYILMILYFLSSILNASNGLLIYFVNKSLSLEKEEEILHNAKLISGLYILYGIIYSILQTIQMYHFFKSY